VNIAFQTTPKEAWFGRDKSWRAAWQQQSQAFGILLVHQRTLLGRAEISRVETKGQIFDSEFMTVVATEPSGDLPPETVISEIRPGYRRHGQVLRLAEVSVSVEPIQKLTQ
jgi:molecular chaperone GrpE (heat shock protein)